MNSLAKIPPPEDSAHYDAWRRYVGLLEIEEARRRFEQDRRRNFVMLWGVLAVLAIVVWLAGPALGLVMVDRLMLLRASAVAVALAAVGLAIAILVEQRSCRIDADDRQRSFDLDSRLAQLQREKPGH